MNYIDTVVAHAKEVFEHKTQVTKNIIKLCTLIHTSDIFLEQVLIPLQGIYLEKMPTYDDLTYRLLEAAKIHDDSKLEEPELGMWVTFKHFYPKKPSYGTSDYSNMLSRIKHIVKRHYSCNDHHPEFFERGIRQMPVVQQFEMLCDWKAAAEAEGNTLKGSIDYNKDRFTIPDNLCSIYYCIASCMEES